MDLIFRNNRLFSINEKLLPVEANNNPTKGALYAAIYDEFKGSAFTEKYKNLTPAQRIEQVNVFALKWLKDRGFNVKKS